jgi:hypothetical protein
MKFDISQEVRFLSFTQMHVDKISNCDKSYVSLQYRIVIDCLIDSIQFQNKQAILVKVNASIFNLDGGNTSFKANIETYISESLFGSLSEK